MDKKRYKKALKNLQDALKEIEQSVGEDKFNFIASSIIFNDNGDVDDESRMWHFGDPHTCLINAESLIEEIKKENEEDKLFNYSLN